MKIVILIEYPVSLLKKDKLDLLLFEFLCMKILNKIRQIYS